MQKRARALETQKLRRTIKARTRNVDPLRDGVSVSLAYVRLGLIWLSVISLDMLIGFRIELLWPLWMMARAGIETMHRNGNTFQFNTHSSAKMSVMFVCVTATSDLICYLFIPVRVLIFLASTYVWMNLVWHANGGFIRTVTTIFTDRPQGVPIVLLWTLVILFEVFCRIRCDYLILTKDGGPLADYLGAPNGCAQVQGLAPAIPRCVNAFLGAHCIGYPLVVVSFSLRYYFKEWRIRRQQEEVSRKNEVLWKLLTEALPAVYEGPRQYQSRLEQEALEYERSGAAEVPMLLPCAAPAANGASVNGSALAATTSSGTPNQGSGGGGKKSSWKQQEPRGGPEKRRDRRRRENKTQQEYAAVRTRNEPEDLGVEGSVVPCEPCWGTESSSGRAPFRLAFEAIAWLLAALLGPAEPEDGSSLGDDYDDDDSSLGDENDSKKNGRAGENSKRNAAASGKQQRPRQSGRHQQAVVSQSSVGHVQTRVHAERPSQTQTEEKHRLNGLPTPAAAATTVVVANGHTKREESTEKAESRQREVAATTKEKEEKPRDGEKDNNNHGTGCDIELIRVRGEVQTAKVVEADLRLQLTMSQANENRAKQEVTQLRSRLEQLQTRLAGVEEARENDKKATTLLERKYAELANRKNEVEKELIAERKGRQEDAGRHKNRADSSAEQREKEARLEAEIDRLRLEGASKDETMLLLEKDLHALRDYKEKHNVEGLQIELRILREKNTHMEQALGEENKLKQELFRALGELRLSNQKLHGELEALRKGGASPPSSELSVRTGESSPLQEKGSPRSVPPPPTHHAMPPPPAYEPMLSSNFMPYNLSVPGVSPTGEHLLFDPAVAQPSLSCRISPREPLLFPPPPGHAPVAHPTQQRSN